jgi:hypothetical protein
VRTAAERLADLVVERFDLTPPVDVESLIAEQGSVLEECDWPFECDAVATGLGTAEPRIFVKAGMHPLRRRFTVAHELGHLMIGWHLNTVMCDAAPDAEGDPSVLGMDQEWEANRFASALLVPRRFLEEITRGSRTIPQVLNALTAADVSAAAGLIAISSHVHPGVVLRTASLTRPVFSDRTGNGIKELAWDEEWPTLKRRATDWGVLMHQGQRVNWYSFWNPREPDDDDDPRDTRTLLVDALTHIGLTGEALDAMRRTVAGVVGAAFANASLSDPAHLFAMLQQRLEGDSRFTALMNDGDFDTFLHRKVREIAERRSGSTRPSAR